MSQEFPIRVEFKPDSANDGLTIVIEFNLERVHLFGVRPCQVLDCLSNFCQKNGWAGQVEDYLRKKWREHCTGI